MTKLERKTYKHGNLHPEAFNCLKLLPTNFSYENDHRKRTPFSIYVNSIREVMKSFNAILDEIDHISTALFKADGKLDYSLKKIPVLQKNLLFALQSHIDDCYSILKLIHPNDTKIKEINAEAWLRKIEDPFSKEFHEAIDRYRTSFAPIFNKIKHDGAKLCPIMMYSTENGIVARTVKTGIQTFPRNTRIVGYFVEAMQPNGHIGPDYEIHPGGKTAISLNRDLRYHFANVYRIGNFLRTAIAKTVRKIHKVKLPYDASVKDITPQYDIELIAERISQLSPLFFENEFFEKTPDIKFHRHNGNAALILEIPGSPYMTWEGEVMIYFDEIQLDAVCRNYQLPYVNEKYL